MNVATCGNPQVSLCTGANTHSLNTAGGDIFFVTGSSFGDVNDNIKVTYGSTGMEYEPSCVIQTAGVRLKCISVPGAGKNLSMLVQVADLGSILFTHALSYQAPALVSVNGPGAFSTTAGGEVVYLSGTNFGPVTSNPWNVEVTYGASGWEFHALNCRVTVANANAQCNMAPGTGAQLKWRIVISAQSSPVFLSTASYMPPSISYYTLSTLPSMGGHVVFIHGQNFGNNYSQVDRIAYTGFGGIVVNVTHLCALFTPHSVVKCVLPSSATSGDTSTLSWSIIITWSERNGAASVKHSICPSFHIRPVRSQSPTDLCVRRGT